MYLCLKKYVTLQPNSNFYVTKKICWQPSWCAVGYTLHKYCDGAGSSWFGGILSTDQP